MGTDVDGLDGGVVPGIILLMHRYEPIKLLIRTVYGVAYAYVYIRVSYTQAVCCYGYTGNPPNCRRKLS